METFKRNFYTWVTGHTKSIVTAFAIMVMLCAILKPMVGVNYDMKDYLPEDSPSTVALEVMNDEYEQGVPNARLMLKDMTIPQVLEYKEKIQAVEGVDSVTWLDDSVDPETPVEVIDDEILEKYYQDGNALLQITIEKDKILTAVSEIEEIAGEENALTGDAVSTAVATESTVREIMLITILAVVMVFIILLLATESWIEPLLILLTIGVAILINGGTNIVFGEISFVTNAAGSVLQLAVSLDYAVFLLHRYHEYRDDDTDPRAAMVNALCRSTNSILSSGITTVIGFMALVLMRFLIGPDLGWALAKGIVISLIAVFVFLPALFLQFNKAVTKTAHRELLPSFNKFGKGVTKAIIPCVIIFVMAIVPAYLASNSNAYYYGASEIFGNDTKLGQDTESIEKTFGENDTYALLLPKGELSKEKALSEEISALAEVLEVISYVDSIGAEIPEEYLEESLTSQLNSENYTRMVISTNTGEEGDEVFRLIQEISSMANKYYPGEYHLAGSGPSNYDLMDTITEDMLKVNLIAIAAVYLVLTIMMHSILLPFLLVISIETAIWINTAIPYFMDAPIFYIAYLIISTVQLGATVDYAILFTDRYRESREKLGRRDAVVETIECTVPSILVSGLTLTIVGVLMGTLSTHGLLAQLGVFIGRGAVCSMVIVFFVLPGLLYLFDKMFINRGKNKMKMKKTMASVIAVLLMLGVFIPADSYAANMPEKEEIVYGNLSHDGTVEKVYVVNRFEDEDIVDYGDYREVKNLTTEDKIKMVGDKVTVNASEAPFYYEGTMGDAQLPWDINIEYFLDGKKYEPSELAGASGRLKIALCIDKNPRGDSFFYDNYAIQATMSLDSNYCRNIVADGATIANVGSDKQLTYTILPGKGADIVVTADVVDFEMSEINISGIKLNMDVDIDTSELTSEAESLAKGTAELDAGASDVKDGVSELQKGASQLLSGVMHLKESISAAAYKAAMKGNGLDVGRLKESNTAAVNQLKGALEQLSQAEAAGVQLSQEQQTQKVMYTQLVTLLERSNAAISGAEAYLDAAGSETAKLEDGAKTLEEGTTELGEGAGALADGTGELAEKTSRIDDKITDEIDEVASGITGSDEVRSFTSSKNTDVKSVQFVLKTGAIEVTETESENAPVPEKGFFEKLLDLFR